MDLQQQLRRTFGWNSDGEAAQALGVLFPGGVPGDAGAHVLRTASLRKLDRLRSPFAGVGLLTPEATRPTASPFADNPFTLNQAAAVPPTFGTPAPAAAAAHQQHQKYEEFEPPAGRRKGRPPVEGVAHTREYLAVKRYRAKKKSMVIASLRTRLHMLWWSHEFGR